MQVNVLGAERRRRWSYDEKVRLVEESLQAGETVCGASGGMTTHVNKVHHVTTITKVAKDLGEHEQ
jgi:transposase